MLRLVLYVVDSRFSSTKLITRSSWPDEREQRPESKFLHAVMTCLWCPAAPGYINFAARFRIVFCRWYQKLPLIVDWNRHTLYPHLPYVHVHAHYYAYAYNTHYTDTQTHAGMLNPAGFLLMHRGFKTQYYKRTFSTAGLSLGICRVLGFCPGVTGRWGLRKLIHPRSTSTSTGG